MDVKVLDISNKEIGKKKLPSQFSEPLRLDIIKRVVVAILSNQRQPYGSDPGAGMRASAKLSRRRHNYKTSYGIGISRVPRKIMSRRGTRLNWRAAFAPGTVGGRRAHPPKAEKIWEKKVNEKERKKAIRSALSAVLDKKLVLARGHIVPETFPFIVEKNFENVDKTKKAVLALKALGFEKELTRVSKKTVRAGKGKARGRKYKRVRGILLVVSNDCKLMKSARSIPGVEVSKVASLNAELLAPGVKPGRLTIFTEEAIEKMEKEKLFN